MIWITLALLLIGIAVLTAAYKNRNSTVTHTGLSGVNQFEDFINGITGTAFTSVLSSGGAVGQSALNNRSTLVLLSNTNSGDSATIRTGGASFLMTTGESLTIAADLALFGSGTPTSAFAFGLAGTGLPLTASSGCDAYFKVDFSVSNNWIAVRNGPGPDNTTITVVPVLREPSGLVGDFTRLKIVSTLDRSLFYIDGVLVANITSVPWAENDHTNVCSQLQTTGGTADIAFAYIDYVSTVFQLATPRLPA